MAERPRRRALVMEWQGFFEESERRSAQLYAEYVRLASEPPRFVLAPGDVVVVAVGLLNRGHLWSREPGTVLAVGQTSVLVRLDRKRYGGEDDDVWLDPVLIRDKLPSEGGR